MNFRLAIFTTTMILPSMETLTPWRNIDTHRMLERGTLLQEESPQICKPKVPGGVNCPFRAIKLSLHPSSKFSNCSDLDILQQSSIMRFTKAKAGIHFITLCSRPIKFKLFVNPSHRPHFHGKSPIAVCQPYNIFSICNLFHILSRIIHNDHDTYTCFIIFGS